MIRRSLFFGLTLVLILAFAFLAVRGCRQDELPAGRPAEIVEKSASTATRALKPEDLEIKHSKMVLEQSAGAPDSSHAARHEIELFNRGAVPYREIRLRFEYFSRNGQPLGTRIHSVDQSIMPRAVLKLTDIRMDGFSESPSEARVLILYADIGNASPPATPRN